MNKQLQDWKWYLVDRMTREVMAGPFNVGGEALEFQAENHEAFADAKLLMGQDVAGQQD